MRLYRIVTTNLMQNNGEAAMQAVMHVHLHIIPRFRGDDMRVRYQKLHPSREQLESIGADIRAEIDQP